jgi:hypothetical protein
MVLGSAPAYGANFSFTGSFNNPNDTPSFFFTADGTSTVNFRTYGWGGGTNAAGTTIAGGGFDPILTLFDAADNFVLQQDDAIGFDFNVNEMLAAGSYRAVISTFPNFSNGTNFANGFENNGNFNGRTSAYAFDILNVTKATGVNSTAVPEPSNLIGTAVAGFVVIGLKRKLAAGKTAKLKISA